MSVMLLKQLKVHLEQLEARVAQTTSKLVEQELAQARQFLSATRDEKWRRLLIKCIKQLEAGAKRVTGRNLNSGTSWLWIYTN